MAIALDGHRLLSVYVKRYERGAYCGGAVAQLYHLIEPCGLGLFPNT